MNGSICKRGLLAPSSITSPETFESPKHYSLPDTAEGVKVKGQIMQRVKGGRVDLASPEEMTEIGPRTGAARVAAAQRIGRAIVLGVLRVLDIDAPFAREELT